MKLIVSGGRDYTNRDAVYKLLDKLNPSFINVGDCPTGVDKFVKDWCNDKLFTEWICYYADWKTEGKKAGPLRNRRMCTQNTDNILIAFPGGKGTASCIKEAKLLNILILRVENEKESIY